MQLEKKSNIKQYNTKSFSVNSKHFVLSSKINEILCL